MGKKQPGIEQPTDIMLQPSTYQPSKAEQEETQDMPNWSLEKIRAAFFRPFRAKECE